MRTNSIIAVDILPCNDGKVVMYGAPNKEMTHLVSGKLRIVLSRPLKIKFISIRLKGTSEVSNWEDSYSCLNVIKLEKILYEKDTLPEGVTDIEYELQVPGNLPQTYMTAFGFINYKLVALVQPSSLMSSYPKVEKGIGFLRHYLPCRREFLPAPPTKIYKGQRKDILSFELDIPTVICDNERSLLIRLRLLPLKEQGRIKKVTFELMQSEKYSTRPSWKDTNEYSIDPSQIVAVIQMNGSASRRRKRTYPIKLTTLSISQENDSWNNPLTYNLPFAQYSSTPRKTRLRATLNSPLMKVRHQFHVVFIFEDDSEKNLELLVPINVTTIPKEKNPSAFNYNDLPSYNDISVENTPINDSLNHSPNINDSETLLNVENYYGSNVPILSLDKQQPRLKQKKSQRSLFGWLIRNENNPCNEDSGTSLSFNSSHSPVISSSSHNEATQFENNQSTSSIVNTSCYLNRPDVDDLETDAAFEIHSEPSSPKLGAIPGSFTTLSGLSLGENLNLTGVNNDLPVSRSKSVGSKSHRRSTSLGTIIESSSTLGSLNAIGSSTSYHRQNIKQTPTKSRLFNLKLCDITEGNNILSPGTTDDDSSVLTDRLNYDNNDTNKIINNNNDINVINVQIPSPTIKIEHI